MSSIRVGVVGVGVMGEIHAHHLAVTVGATLAAVYDVDGDRAGRVATATGAVALSTPEELIASVDAVLIASSDTTHADLLHQCLAARRPTLCEKPLAMTLDDARALVEAERATGRQLVQLGFMREFDPTHVAVRDAVRSGRLGRPVMFRGTHVNPNVLPFRMTAEDAIVRSMIHDLHSTRFLTGCEFVEVHARSVRADDDPAFTRLVTVSASLTNDAVALIDVNMEANYGYEVSAEVVCTEGTARTVLPASAAVATAGSRADTVPMHWGTRFADAYRLEVAAWVRSVAEGQVVGPTSADGLAAQLVADACCRSLHSGQPELVA